MTDFLHFMLPPLAACLVLAGIHAYLGLHVIERQVIFVDLALAQIAALGAGLALLGGHELNEPISYWISLAFTLAGALVFSLTRFRKQRIPQEAFIGLTYAVAAALLILVLSRTGEGDEHIRYALAGNLLLVGWDDVIKIGIVYAAVGIFHGVLRGPFLMISRDPEGAARSGMNLALWDFLFYASFGVVVTSSVKIAGVLVVFSLLVAPASVAVLFANSVRTRLILGWGIGMLGSFLGVVLSYLADLPTGASVVCVFGALVLGAAVLKRLFLHNIEID